jgi:aerobic-type carbon monoxide dehydrogenase small subunit (CoxS/CutS family)
MEKTIAFTVNGQPRTVTTDPTRPLLEVLREDLHLTGTKCGCGEGKCGACTVLINGRSVVSCITPVANLDQQSVVTIEGLSRPDQLHPVQEAFLAEGAMQCGYCTPGMILAVVGLLNERPQPTDKEILSTMEAHLCRCCGYTRILKAVRRAAAASR